MNSPQRSLIFYILPGLIAAFGGILAAAGIGDIANYGGGAAAWLYLVLGVLGIVGGTGAILAGSGALKG